MCRLSDVRCDQRSLNEPQQHLMWEEGKKERKTVTKNNVKVTNTKQIQVTKINIAYCTHQTTSLYSPICIQFTDISELKSQFRYLRLAYYNFLYLTKIFDDLQHFRFK